MKPLGEISSKEDHEEAITRMRKLADETRQDQTSWIDQEKESLEIFILGVPKSEYRENDTLTVNEIQSAILATSPSEPPRIKLTPVETGDPGLQIPIQTMDPMMPVQVVQINDLMVRKVYQKLFDVYWQRSRLDEILRRGRIWTRTKGWQFYQYGFDDERQVISLRTLSNVQCYPDRLQEFIRDFAHMGVDEYLDAGYAKDLYPHLREKIEEEKEEGIPATDIGTATTPEKYDGTYQRDMICLTTFWFRFERMPMTPEEVSASGMFNEIEVPTGEMVPAVGIDGEQLANEDGSPMLDPENRMGFFDQEGNEVMPGSPEWPTRSYIREVQSIGGEVVSDRECEHWDIPILHDVHIPIFGRPWGIGDVFKLKKLQAAQSSMLDSIVKYTQVFGQPVRWLPQSVYNATKQVYHKAYIDPTMTMIVPDSLVQQFGGKLDFGQTAPQMNQALPQSYGILKSTMSEQSGYTQELRGIASDPEQSGKQTALLTQNATSLNEFMGRAEEDMLYRLARMILHSLVTRLEVPQLMRVCSEYPPEVLVEIINKARSMEWDIMVEVSTGTGMVNNLKRSVWFQDLQSGVISMQTYRELTGYDHEKEMSRQMNEAMMMAPPPGEDGGGEGGGGEKPPGDKDKKSDK